MTDQTTEPDEGVDQIDTVSGDATGSPESGNTEQERAEEHREQASDHVVGADKMVDDEPETFPLSYVKELRQEAAEHRVRAKDRDALAERLHVALVAATGRLADPTDLPFSEAHLDEDALMAAIEELLARKPHLASRRPMGSVGQGVTAPSGDVDLAAMLRGRA